MPRDSQGNYSLPNGSIVSTGDTILPSQHNPALQDIAAALSASLARSGVGGMLGTLFLNGNDIKTIRNVEAQGSGTFIGDISAGNINVPAGGEVRFGSFIFHASYVDNRPTIFFDDSSGHYIDWNPVTAKFRFVISNVVVATVDFGGNIVLRGTLYQNANPS